MIPGRLNILEIINYLNNYKISLLSTDYKNNKQILKMKCEYEHIFHKSFSNFKIRPYCKICYKSNIRERLSLKYKTIKEIVESEKYILLFSENDYNEYYKYKGNKTKIKTMCPNGHIWEVIFNNFNIYKNRCKFCFRDKNSGHNHYRYNPIREEISFNNKLRKSFDYTWIIHNMKDDPNYDNFLLNPKDYEVDHIIPISLFSKITSKYNLIDYKVKKIINKRNNLQLLLLKDNDKKCNKGSSLFEATNYLINNGIPFENFLNNN